jgi:transposase-like protein
MCSPEFRLETAQLVVDQGYTHHEATKAMGVGFSTIVKWVNRNQLNDGITLLGKLVAIITEVMIDNLEALWGEANYPVMAYKTEKINRPNKARL